jgi:hypothetical protein
VQRDPALRPPSSWTSQSSVKIGRDVYRGTVEASFATSDFSRLLSDLDQVMNGSGAVASFTTMEEALDFRVEVDRAGRATVTG